MKILRNLGLLTALAILPEYVFAEEVKTDDTTILLNYGIPSHVISSMDKEERQSIVFSFNKGKLDEDTAAKLTSSPWKYSIEKAKNDSDYRLSREELVAKILSRLKGREHICRKDTDYYENIEQVGLLKDKNLLVLLDKHIDYFDRPESLDFMDSLFPDGEDSSEKGGIVYSSDSGLDFRAVDTCWQITFFPQFMAENFNEKNNYMVPFYAPFVGSIGLFHTHPASKEQTEKYGSGPSGSLRPLSTMEVSDTGVLASMNETNPYHIHTVITRISEGEYNVDLCLRDVELKTPAVPVNKDEVTVIDIGIFRRNQ